MCCNCCPIANEITKSFLTTHNNIIKPGSQYDAEPRVASRYEFVNGKTRTLRDATLRDAP